MKHNDEMSKIALVGPGGRKKLKDILKSVESKVVPQAQADFNQEDETKPDYIKNKPAELTADDILDLLAQKEYFTIEAKEASTTIAWKSDLDDDDEPRPKTIQVSTDGVTWTSKTSDEDGTALATLNAGDKLFIKGNNTSYGWNDDGVGGSYFVSDKDVYIYGNIMTLIYGETAFSSENRSVDSYAFPRLFAGIKSHLYFRPDKKLSLPAKVLGYRCYYQMFNGCTNITTAPKLNFLTLAGQCCYSMFSGCTSLTTAPDLLATSFVSGCYDLMFNGCTSLSKVKCLLTGNIHFNSWLYGTSPTGTFIKHPNSTWDNNTDGIPSGWTVETATS